MFESIFLAVQLAAVSGQPSAEAADATLLAQQSGHPTLAIGANESGRLEPGDRVLNSGEFADYYEFEGEAGDQVEISMRSQQFNTYVGVTAVEGTGGASFFAHANDDAPGRGTNSHLVVTLPHTGRYRVQATSAVGGEQGNYELSLDAYSGGGLGTSTSASSRPANSQSSLQAGSPVQGALAATDPQLRSGEFMDTFHYEGAAGERVSITLNSTEFDTYLMLRGPGNTSIDNDDIAEGNYNSGIGATLPQAGTYRVVVTSYEPGEVGSYRLELQSSGRADTVVQRELTLNAPVTGTLATSGQSDPTRPGGQAYQSWTFNAAAGTSVTIDLESNDFDTVLELVMPGGGTQTNDDIARNDTNSRINAILPDDGTYEVRASSYLPAVGGDYTLMVAAANVDEVLEQAREQQQDAVEGDAIAFGQVLDGRLNRRDTQLASGEYYDTISFSGTAGQSLTLSLESSQFDTYLMIRGPAGVSYDNDDADGTNSRLEVSLPADGVYTILATSYAPGETGRYTLTLEEGTTIQRNAQGRVFAILAGITDYADASDLPFCAEDATNLGMTLESTGILSDTSMVLTDEQVTAANLERAFEAVAREAGPDDVFLFFYSGHGAHLENGRELDGRDETLYLFDGHVTDDQVNEWFDMLDTRMSIIALDSCFSGGFARDVISAPNRMGIFSSEEDVTSNVASRFQAGGYLSYFLRNAIAGAADAEPRDGIITAGELSQYLHRQWAANNMANESTETTDAALAYQNLVIDRGSVKVTDVVVYNQ